MKVRTIISMAAMMAAGSMAYAQQGPDSGGGQKPSMGAGGSAGGDAGGNVGGNAGGNSAADRAPGQVKEPGSSARGDAPGQVKEPGQSARDDAPGQNKMGEGDDMKKGDGKAADSQKGDKDKNADSNKGDLDKKNADADKGDNKNAGNKDDSGAATGKADGTAGAGKGDLKSVTSEQRTKVQSTFRSNRVEPARNLNISVNVGVRVPRDVRFYSIPQDIIVVVPQYRDYRYFIFDDKVCIVDPDTYEIVDIIILA